jgi:hypothetical protein
LLDHLAMKSQGVPAARANQVRQMPQLESFGLASRFSRRGAATDFCAGIDL